MGGPQKTKVAVACQGGGMHAAFAVGALTEILKDVDKQRFRLVGLSGSSAGALCALIVWYSLAPKRTASGLVTPGSVVDAIYNLNQLWENFVAATGSETALNFLTYGAFRAGEKELPLLGLSIPVLSPNPHSAIYKAVAASLPSMGVRTQYFDLMDMLTRACPDFNDIDWSNIETRVLIGASEVVNGFETVFDSDVNKLLQRNNAQRDNKGMQPVKTLKDKARYWRQQLPLCLHGVAASGTLPTMREAEHIGDGYYWDGLYSQNPPVREFLSGTNQNEIPDELWVVRINPQQWPEVPKSNKDIQDRQNELMGNLSLNKELDFIITVNAWNMKYEGQEFAMDHKHVTVRTIKMTSATANQLSYSSKFDRSRAFMDKMRREGREVAREWLDRWKDVPEYPEDAAY